MAARTLPSLSLPSLDRSRSASALTGGKSGQNGSRVFRACADRLAAFLRRAHPTKTPHAVAAEIGVPADTVRKWLDGTARPGFCATLSLIAAYGPEFLSAVYGSAAPEWLDEARRASDRAALLALHDQLLARLKRTT